MRRTLPVIVGLLVVAIVVPFAALALWLRSDGVRETIVAQAESAIGRPVRIGSARVAVFPRPAVELVNVAIDEPPRAQLGSVSVAVPFGALWTRRVEEADLRISGGQSDASLLGVFAAARPDRSHDGDRQFSIGSVRSIRLRDVTLVAGKARVPINLDASLLGDRLIVSNVELEAAGSTMTITGEMSSLSRREGHFDVRSDVLPVADLVGILGGLVQEGDARGAAPTPAPFRVTAAVAAPTAIIGTKRAESFEARLEATPKGVVLEPVSFNLDGGRFELRLTTSDAGRLAIGGQITNLDTARSRHDSVEKRDAFAGRLDATFAIQTPLVASAAALLANAWGSADITVRDGRMPGIEAVRTAVLRFAGRSDGAQPSAGNDAFSRLSASTTLKDGTVRIDRVTMTASDFEMAGEGTYVASSGRLSMAADVTLSEALSAQAGRDLYRYARDGRRVVLPAIIGGTLDSPSVTIDIAQATLRALRNRAGEEAKSILDRLLKGRQ